jgi:hypothetical protein
MKYHNMHFNWLWRDEAVCLIGFATGRVNGAPHGKWLYSFRVFLGVFKIEILWHMGAPSYRADLLTT